MVMQKINEMYNGLKKEISSKIAYGVGTTLLGVGLLLGSGKKAEALPMDTTVASSIDDLAQDNIKFEEVNIGSLSFAPIYNPDTYRLELTGVNNAEPDDFMKRVLSMYVDSDIVDPNRTSEITKNGGIALPWARDATDIGRMTLNVSDAGPQNVVAPGDSFIYSVPVLNGAFSGNGNLKIGYWDLNLTDIEGSSKYGRVNPVPEPATVLLLGIGLLGLAGYGRNNIAPVWPTVFVIDFELSALK